MIKAKKFEEAARELETYDTEVNFDREVATVEGRQAHNKAHPVETGQGRLVEL